MEAIKQIVRTPANHEIRIAIPPEVQEDEPIEVIVIMRKRKDDFKHKDPASAKRHAKRSICARSSGSFSKF